MAEIFSKKTPQETKKGSERDPIHDEVLGECFLPSEILEEILEELPSKATIPPPTPKKKDPEALISFGRKRVKSTNFIVLLDPRRPALVIDRVKNIYSTQRLHEAQYTHLELELQELIRLLLQIPFIAVVAEADWQNPPKFQIQYTLIADRDEKDSFNAIFADKAFFNKGIRHRALSVELENLPRTLTKDLIKTMDIAEVEALHNKIQEIIQKLLAAESGSPVYKSILNELDSLPEGMPEKITELIALVKRVDLEDGSEELCMIKLDYPTWELKEAWNYANPYKLWERRKYRKLLQVIIEQLRGYLPAE
jgi:hypothetical protein